MKTSRAGSFFTLTLSMVLLAVLPAAGATLSILEQPPLLHFTFYEGGPNPTSATFAISKIGDGSLDWVIEPNEPGGTLPDWLTVDPMSGSLSDSDPAVVTVSVDISGLSAGLYSASFGIVAPGAEGSPQFRTVRLSIAEDCLAVPAAYPTIQAAIDAVEPDEACVILVEPGIYTGPGNRDISCRGKAVVVRSADGPETCIIDCQGSEHNIHRGFVFTDGEGGNCVLDGFTIRNGYHTTEDLGGVADGYGGGIYIFGSSPVIRNCILENNHVDGWAVECFFYASVYGGGLYSRDGSPLVENCLFLNNEAPFEPPYQYPMGVHSLDGLYAVLGSPIIRNCTFINDDLRLVDEGEVLNCIFSGGDPESSVIRYSAYAGGDGSNGNTNADPLFADSAAQDYHLKSQYGRWDSAAGQWITDAVTSPCIDAGEPDDEAWKSELWPHGKRINMGFYGGTPQASMSPLEVGLVSDVDHDGLTGVGDLALMCEDWLLSEPLLDTDLNRDNRVDLADAAVLSGQWGQTYPAFLFVPDTKFTFIAYEGGISPNPHAFTIVNYGDQPCDWSADLTGMPDWLLVSPASGILDSNTRKPVMLSVDTLGLTEGEYSCSFEISAPGAANSPKAIQVKLKVFSPQQWGNIIGWGRDNRDQASPPLGNDYVALAAGREHSLALKSEGSIVGWGCNFEGEATPPVGNGYVAIAAGYVHSLALKSDGSIVCWGNNDYDQAIPPAGNDYVAIAAACGSHSLALKSDGSIVGWGRNDHGQATPPAGNDYVAVAAGGAHSLALKSDGSIVGWGGNGSGQASPPAGNDYVAIAGGNSHSLALKSDGSIVGWGYNGYGLATPPVGNDYVAIAAGFDHNLALRSDGTIVGWGRNDYGEATPPAGNDYVAITAGDSFSLAIRGTGLNVSANQFAFNVDAGASNPAPQTLIIGNNGNALFSWSADLSGLPGWLAVSPASGTLGAGESEPVTLAVDITGLAAGQYSYSFPVSAPGAPGSPRTITVTLRVPREAPVGHWQLDETAGLTAFDSSGFGHDGTLVNMVPSDWVGGLLGGALAFDGIDDYVRVEDSDRLDFGLVDDFTVCGWFQTTQINNGSRILYNSGLVDSKYQGYAIFLNTDDNGAISFRTWSGANRAETRRIAVASGPYNDGQWRHVAGVRRAGQALEIYVDGELKGTVPVEYGRDLSNSMPLTLGAEVQSDPGGMYFYEGLLDDVRIYERALSATEIATLAGR